MEKKKKREKKEKKKKEKRKEKTNWAQSLRPAEWLRNMSNR